jgi:cytochrome P450 PksS
MRDLNPVSPENLLNPVPLYKELRENDPVHWSPHVHSWVLTRYDDVMNCFRDSRLNANQAVLLERQLQMLGVNPDSAREVLETTRIHMANQVGAQHLRHRRLASPGFTPQVLDTWRPSIRRIMNALVERVQADGQADLVPTVSYQLPPLVIAEMLGIPAEHRELFQKWSEPLAEFSSPTTVTDFAALAPKANAAVVELSAYLAEEIGKRRLNPSDDVLSRLLHSQEQGKLTEAELIANSVLILLAGHLTTTDQLSNGIYTLLTHPEQLQRLQQDPTLVRTAVEEVMRFNPAVPFMHRMAMETIELRGKTIKQGDMVMLGMAAANRDPAVFPDPDRFDITRDHAHQKHMSFGFGSHHCLGAGLARRELEIAFEVLLERLPGLRLDETKEMRVKCHSLLFRGFDALPIRW